MGDETDKVVSLFDRKPYEAPHVEPLTPESIDEDSIGLLRELIERFERGELKGMAIVVWCPMAGCFYTITQLPPGVPMQEAAYRFTGGIEELRQQVLDQAIMGEDYDVELEDE